MPLVAERRQPPPDPRAPWEALEAKLGGSVADPATTWKPCRECLAAGGWEAGTRDVNGRRCWPVPAHKHGRPNQHFDWHRFRQWIARMGRGTGKTRSAAEDRLELAGKYAKTLWYVVAPTFADGRDYCFEGDSGLVQVALQRGLITDVDRAYNKTTLQLTLDNGSKFIFRSGTEPERLRGPNAHGAWVDEPASIPKLDAVLKQLDMLVRAKLPDGHPTTILLTGTPSRRPAMRALLAQAAAGEIGLQIGSTYDNAANLDEAFLGNLLKYEGTEWGRQEIEGLLLAAVEGALWREEWIEACRAPLPEPLERVVVAVDPAASKKDTADMVGIITVALGVDGHGYVTHDDSRRGMPAEWSLDVVRAAMRWDPPKSRRGASIVVEGNLVGDWFVDTIRQAMDTLKWHCPIRQVHAAEGKQTRAEPLSMVYAGGAPRIHHIHVLGQLEDELVSWTPDLPSPNRLDALVWAAHDLGLAIVPKKSGGRASNVPTRPSAGLAANGW